MAWGFSGATFDNDDGTIRVTLNGQTDAPNNYDDGMGGTAAGWSEMYVKVVMRAADTSTTPDYGITGFESHPVGGDWTMASEYDDGGYDPPVAYGEYSNLFSTLDLTYKRITFNLTYMLVSLMYDENNNGEFYDGDPTADHGGENGYVPEGWGSEGAYHGIEGGYYIKNLWYMKPDGNGGSSEVMWPVAEEYANDTHANNPGYGPNRTHYVDWVLGRNNDVDETTSYWDFDTSESYIEVEGVTWWSEDMGPVKIYASDWNIENLRPDINNWSGGTGDPHIKPYFGGPYNL